MNVYVVMGRDVNFLGVQGCEMVVAVIVAAIVALVVVVAAAIYSAAVVGDGARADRRGETTLRDDILIAAA